MRAATSTSRSWPTTPSTRTRSAASSSASGRGDHSLTHVADYNHLLFFVEGSGEITVGKRTWPLSPGSYAKVKAGEQHSLRNLGDIEMLILTVYDPPRVRA